MRLMVKIALCLSAIAILSGICFGQPVSYELKDGLRVIVTADNDFIVEKTNDKWTLSKNRPGDLELDRPAKWAALTKNHGNEFVNKLVPVQIESNHQISVEGSNSEIRLNWEKTNSTGASPRVLVLRKQGAKWLPPDSSALQDWAVFLDISQGEVAKQLLTFDRKAPKKSPDWLRLSYIGLTSNEYILFGSDRSLYKIVSSRVPNEPVTTPKANSNEARGGNNREDANASSNKNATLAVAFGVFLLAIGAVALKLTGFFEKKERPAYRLKLKTSDQELIVIVNEKEFFSFGKNEEGKWDHLHSGSEHKQNALTKLLNKVGLNQYIAAQNIETPLELPLLTVSRESHLITLKLENFQFNEPLKISKIENSWTPNEGDLKAWLNFFGVKQPTFEQELASFDDVPTKSHEAWLKIAMKIGQTSEPSKSIVVLGKQRQLIVIDQAKDSNKEGLDQGGQGSKEIRSLVVSTQPNSGGEGKGFEPQSQPQLDPEYLAAVEAVKLILASKELAEYHKNDYRSISSLLTSYLTNYEKYTAEIARLEAASLSDKTVEKIKDLEDQIVSQKAEIEKIEPLETELSEVKSQKEKLLEDKAALTVDIEKYSSWFGQVADRLNVNTSQVATKQQIPIGQQVVAALDHRLAFLTRAGQTAKLNRLSNEIVAAAYKFFAANDEAPWRGPLWSWTAHSLAIMVQTASEQDLNATAAALENLAKICKAADQAKGVYREELEVFAKSIADMQNAIGVDAIKYTVGQSRTSYKLRGLLTRLLEEPAFEELRYHNVIEPNSASNNWLIFEAFIS